MSDNKTTSETGPGQGSTTPALDSVSPPPELVVAPPPEQDSGHVSPPPPPRQVASPPPPSPSPQVASPPPPLPSPPPNSPPPSPSPPPPSSSPPPPPHPHPLPPPSPVVPSPPPPIEPKPSPPSPAEEEPKLSPPPPIVWSPPPPVVHHPPPPFSTPTEPHTPPPSPATQPHAPAPSESPPPPIDKTLTPSLNITTPSLSKNQTTVPSPARSESNSSMNKDTVTHSPSTSGSFGTESDAAAHSSLRTGLIVGGSIGGVMILLVVAIFFFSGRRNKRRKLDVYNTPYMPPANFIVDSDGYFYGQPHARMNSSYMSQPPQSASVLVNSYDSQPVQSYPIGTPKSFYSYEELMEITNGFMRENIIGEGGFGAVFKGWLADGRLVAVKQLKAGSGQGEREFRAEVEIISRVHHRHLVSLVGYCISEHQRLLIYEFLPNKTLEHHLHGKGMPVLEWTKRMKIALGAARGLAYLHEDCQPKIIHRDIKSANILLDEFFEAQVADFGLAKLTDDNNTHVSTRVMGTFGYMAPEYATSGKLTDRSDVFSFGVVLLELITGRKPVDPTQPFGDESLVEWARPLLVTALETGDISELVDPRLENHFVHPEMLRMIEAAAACVRHSAPKRPRMMQVVRALDCENNLTDLSNGVKYGQSTVYDSGQYSKDITNFRRMAFGSDDCADIEMYSDEYNSGEVANGNRGGWISPGDSSEYTRSSAESETRAINVHQ